MLVRVVVPVKYVVSVPLTKGTPSESKNWYLGIVAMVPVMAAPMEKSPNVSGWKGLIWNLLIGFGLSSG